MHKEWLDIKSVEVNVQKGLSNLLYSKGKLESKKALKAQEVAQEAQEAFRKYYEKGDPRKSGHHADQPDAELPDLISRRHVHEQRKSQKRFLNSILARVQVKPVLFVWALIDLQSQEYGTKYWTAVCDVSTVMESFANYLRYVRRTETRRSD